MEFLRINGGTRIPLSDVVIRASRSSGPGGQHANMTSSRIEVSFDVRASEALSPGQRLAPPTKASIPGIPRISGICLDFSRFVPGPVLGFY